MSHLSTIDLVIKDLPAAKETCVRLGLEFRENKPDYKWFGEYVGDTKPPADLHPRDYGKCHHAIGVPGNRQAYEMGLVPMPNGQPGYRLMFDNWQGGYGLIEKIGGNDGGKFKQTYADIVAGNKAQALVRQGFRVQRTVTPEGRIQIRATR